MSGGLGELQAYREIFRRCALGQFPLMPWAELPQDPAFIAASIDHYRASILAMDHQMRAVVMDLWSHVPRADIELLDQSTRDLIAAIQSQDG